MTARSVSPKQFLDKVLQSGDRALSPKERLDVLGIPPIILLSCADHYRTRKFAHKVREVLAIESSPESAASYFGQELNSNDSIEQLSNSLCFRSLFSKTELITIYDIEAIKSSQHKKLLDKLSHPHIEPLVLCTCSSQVGKKNSPPLVNNIAQIGITIFIPEMSIEELPRWIEGEVANMGEGIRVDKTAIALLVALYGNDPSALHQQLSKLSLLVSPGDCISSELVKQTCSYNMESSINDLLLAMAHRDVMKTSQICAQLITQGTPPLQITSFLSSSLRTLLMHAGKQKRPSRTNNYEEELSAELSRPWILNKLRNIMGHFSFRDLQLSLEALRDLDLSLKSSSFQPEVAISLAMYKIASRSF